MAATNVFTLECVLFDLDGTLVDTAPDLVANMNRAFAVHGYAEVASEIAMLGISYGAAAMIQRCLGGSANAAAQAEVLETMLALYAQNIAEQSRCFDGMSDLLDVLDSRGLKWGIVTNKQERFSLPLLESLQLSHRAACIISGDTTAHPKPHPAQMLAACQQAAVAPENCVYIGDARHDVAAGHSVQMKTLAAAYGYLKPEDRTETWGADALVYGPQDILAWVEAALCR